MFPFGLVRLVRRSRRSASVVAALVVAGLVGREPLTRAQTSLTKLTTVLADVAKAVRQDDPSTPPTQAPLVAQTSLPKSAQDAIHARGMRVDASGAVQVYVLLSDVSVGALQALTNAGVTIQIPDAPNFRVQATIPLTRLTAVASLPFVNFIRLPNYAIRRAGAVQTEGDAILHADTARAQFSVDGTGVKVGVISDGLKGVFATGCTSNCAGVASGPISTGDLPTATGTRNAVGKLTASAGGIVGQSFAGNGDLEGLTPGCAFAGAGAEGTALLEIVHDLAPGAALAFANADTDVAFNQAVNALASGNDVVVDDLGFFIPPFDGTNSVSANTAAALNNNANRIRAYITANGNEAADHYIGAYVDSGVDGGTISGITQSGHLHLFQSSASTTDVLALGPQPFNVLSLLEGASVHVILVWDDPVGHSSNNYDLYLVRKSTNAVVASSTDAQSGSGDPFEALDFTNSGAADQFRIVVQNVGNTAAPKNLNIISYQGECDKDGPMPLATGHHELLNFNSASNSVFAQSDAGGTPVSVISVGAICSASAKAAGGQPTDESCADPSHATAEFFSGRGPTLDGRIKPDISAIDGVSITGAGSFENPFFGTSAAAPHVAGEAALVLQAASCLASTNTFGLDAPTARAKLSKLLLSSADARSGAPPDNVFGAGLANVQKAIQASLPTFTGPAQLVVNGNVAGGARLNGSQLGFTDPDGCPLQRVSWTGGCGTSPDSAMTCPLGTTNVSVAASNSGTAFSTASAVQVTVTGFTIAGVPSAATVTAGQPAHYQLNITPQSGPFTNPVALSCSGLPQGAACIFSPSTVTPGGSTAQAAVTISTTARTAAFALPMPQAPIGGGWSIGRSAIGRGSIDAQAILATLAIVALSTGVLAIVLVTAAPDRRRLSLAATSAAIAAFALQIACGSKNTGSPTTVALTPTSLTFSSQSTSTTSPPQLVTLTNTGASALSVTGLGASGDFSQTNNCGTTVAPGGSCQITVTFTPTAAGSRTGTLTVNDTGANSPQKVSLTGTGVKSIGATPAGSFQVIVNGSAGTFVASGTITLIVQ